jgi:hypothetical protein
LQTSFQGRDWLYCTIELSFFSVEKFKADGMLDKFKSLMVANGNGQDPKVYLDRSSPMVVVHSILTCLCMAVYNNTYKIV